MYQRRFGRSASTPLGRSNIATTRELNEQDVKIAIICALPLEAEAIDTLFDHHSDELVNTCGLSSSDPNSYTFGHMGLYRVVLVHMPSMGKVAAANVSANLNISFPGIQLAFVVGICGGVPSASNDEMILGDVVVSSGVVEYDFGRHYDDGLHTKREIHNPQQALSSRLAKIQMSRIRGSLELKMSSHLDRVTRKIQGSNYPGAKEDRLFLPTYRHKHRGHDARCSCTASDTDSGITCGRACLENCRLTGCDGTLVHRKRLSVDNPKPMIHFGLIASASIVMKSGVIRDKIARDLNVVAFEMEGCGVWANLPTLVVKGVSDYADSHKSKSWQRYAAATAAATARTLIDHWGSIWTTEAIAMPQPVLSHSDMVDASVGPDPGQQDHFILPFSRNSGFVGRSEQLNMLEDMFVSRKFSSRAAVFGLGGIGKSSLALEFLYRTRSQNPKLSVFWITCATPDAFEESYRKVAQAILTHDTGHQEEDLKSRVKTCLSAKDASDWLMVFDNADDLDTWSVTKGSRVRLADFVPSHARGFALLTTRNRQVAARFAQRDMIELSEMDEAMAETLLRSSLGRSLPSDDSSVLKLMKLLYGLPLAVVQAAAYMTYNDFSPAQYVTLLEESEESLIETLSEDYEDNGRYRDQKNPVLSTWLLSFEWIRKHQPQAEEYLSFLSYMESSPIPSSLLPPPQSQRQFLKAISCLKGFSFVREELDGSLHLHPLVQLATRNWLESRQQAFDIHKLVISRLSAVYPSPSDEDRGLWPIYLPHALKALRLCEENAEQDALQPLLQRVAQCLLDVDNYADGEPILIRAIDITIRLFGPDHEKTLDIWSDLAVIHRDQSRLKKAEELEKSLLNTSLHVLGPEHPGTLTRKHRLALIYWSQDRWTEAQELDREVLRMRKAILGPSHPDTLSSQRGLASTYFLQNRWNEAEDLQVELLEASRKLLGPEHLQTTFYQNDLACTWAHQGRYTEAEELQVKCFATLSRVLGQNHVSTLMIQEHLALTYQRQCRWKEAEDFQRRHLAVCLEVLGCDHSGTLRSQVRLASILIDRGQWSAALEILTECVQTCLRVLGPEHTDTLSSQGYLAATYRRLGRYSEAAELQRGVIGAFTAIMGPGCANALRYQRNLAFTMSESGMWTQAEELLLSSIKELVELFGPESSEVLISQICLASTYRRQQRWSEEEKLLTKVLEVRKRIPGPLIDTLVNQAMLASNHRNQGRLDEAEALGIQVLEKRKKIIPDHPYTLTSQSDLGATYRLQGRLEEAAELGEEAVNKLDQALGGYHPDTMEAKTSLAATLCALAEKMTPVDKSESDGTSGTSRVSCLPLF